MSAKGISPTNHTYTTCHVDEQTSKHASKTHSFPSAAPAASSKSPRKCAGGQRLRPRGDSVSGALVDRVLRVCNSQTVKNSLKWPRVPSLRILRQWRRSLDYPPSLPEAFPTIQAVKRNKATRQSHLYFSGKLLPAGVDPRHLCRGL